MRKMMAALTVLLVGVSLYAVLRPFDELRAQQAQDAALAQNEKQPKVSLDVSGADLEDVLKSLSKQAKVKIALDKNVTGKKVTIKLDDVELETMLKLILSPLGLSWKKEGDAYLVYRQVRGILKALKGEYFDDKNFTMMLDAGTALPGPFFERKIFERMDEQIDFVWNETKAPVPGVGNQYWSVRWTGNLDVPENDTYTFFIEMLDDAARLYLDDKLIIDAFKIQPATNYKSDPIELEKGKHPIKLEYHQGPGGASVRLLLESTKIEKKVIEFDPPLKGEYYEDPDQEQFPPLFEPPAYPTFVELKVTKEDDKIDFNWSPTPHPAIDDQHWSVRWTGQIYVPEDDEYVFSLDNLSDGGRLWIDDMMLIDSWIVQQGATQESKPIKLKEGLHPLKVEFHAGPPPTSSITLSWKSTKFPKEVIPAIAEIPKAKADADK